MSDLIPESKKINLESISSESLNKEIAYLFGVYLTDGCIDSGNRFTLQVIDEDFANNTLNFIKKIKPNCKAEIYKRDATKTGGWNKSIQYCIHAGFTEFKDFFEKQTNKKHHIPFIIWDASLEIKRWFIAGVLDGDGWIKKHKRDTKKQLYQIGIGGIEDGWVLEFKEFLERNGLIILKPYRSLTNAGVPFYCFDMNVDSFISKGLFFTVKRKQDRVLLYIKERSETKGYISEGIKI